MQTDDLYIQVEGKGIPIILLHGWGLNHYYMEPLFQYFKNTYKVCMLDLPGFGNSILPYAYDLSEYVEKIREIIEIYELENPVLVAHSFGARIAFRYASKYPTRFVIATGAAGIKPKRGIRYYTKVCIYKIIKKMHLQKEMGSEDYKNAQGDLKKTFVKIVNDHNHDDILKIKCPILLIWGEKDMETPLWMAKKIEKLNKNTTLIILKGEDHFAYYHQMSQFIKICEYALKEVK